MDDPDAPAGTWVHWVLYNLPPVMRNLPEDYTPTVDGLVGSNSWKREDYSGPCPPSGQHRYFFKLYALDTVLAESGLDKTSLLKLMEGHVLAQGQLMGVYEKP
jgi:Raf kinase inhibitor-like YbhB/YbcL family protein